MFSGLLTDFLDLLQDQILDLVASSVFIYMVGGVLVALLVVSIFGMIRDTFSALGVSQGVGSDRVPSASKYDARVTMFGVKMWGHSELMLDDLSDAGFVSVGRRVRSEDFVHIDENGVQDADPVTVEFYQRYKK